MNLCLKYKVEKKSNKKSNCLLVFYSLNVTKPFESYKDGKFVLGFFLKLLE